jgi:hypothetical protein
LIIKLRVDGDGSADELRALHKWLADQHSVRLFADISLEREPAGEGAMGDPVAWISLVTQNGFEIINLAIAYAAWRATRKRPTTSFIEIDGAKAPIPEGATAQEIERIARALRAQSE